MRKMNNVRMMIATTIFGAAVAMAATAGVQAATFKTYDPNVKMETPNSKWNEVKDPDTLITLTDGKDVVKVKRFDKTAQIPAATIAADNYEEIYQTFYTTKDNVYLVSGFAADKDSIDEVRDVVESIQLADHQKEEAATGTKEVKKTAATAERTGNKKVLYYSEDKSVIVYEYSNGKWKDANGVSFWTTVEHEWANSNGDILFDYKPIAPKSDKVVDRTTLYTGTGNPVVIKQYSDGEWLSDDGVRFRDNCDGTWSNSNGETYYETDDITTTKEFQEMRANEKSEDKEAKTVEESNCENKEAKEVYDQDMKENDAEDCYENVNCDAGISVEMAE